MIGAVLGPNGELLDLGRWSRYPSTAQRRALGLLHRTCSFPSCDRPFSWCQIHHIIHWEDFGPTDTWNLMTLCRKHHREKTFGTSAYRPGPLGELIITTDTGHRHRTTPKGPLARAREAIREREWNAFVDRLISADGYITNPPGADRPRGRPA